MKKTLRFLSTLLFVITIASFSKKKKDPCPPGTVKVGSNLFCDKTEVSNINWREFQYSLLAVQKDTALYNLMQPDSLVWQKNNELYKPLSEYYFRNPSYNFYPVVGVCYSQALEFCKWRSEMVNDLYSRHPYINPYPGKKYTYRLPTIEEWEKIAGGEKDINQYPYGMDSIYTRWHGNWTKSFHCKYALDKEPEIMHGASDRLPITAKTDAYWPNAFSVYNIIGNVSEITAIEGISKGGNWTLPVKECTVKSEQKYSTPCAWLGFRCVCEIIN